MRPVSELNRPTKMTRSTGTAPDPNSGCVASVRVLQLHDRLGEVMDTPGLLVGATKRRGQMSPKPRSRVRAPRPLPTAPRANSTTRNRVRRLALVAQMAECPTEIRKALVQVQSSGTESPYPLPATGLLSPAVYGGDLISLRRSPRGCRGYPETKHPRRHRRRPAGMTKTVPR